MKIVWQRQSNCYIPQEDSAREELLYPAIYNLQFSQVIGLYLEKTSEKFEFPYKIYGMENEFIERVVKTKNNTTGNLGVALVGVKGTGKTVTAENICNRLDLPVIVIGTAYTNLPNFLSKIQQDCIVFFDEYEKTFTGSNAKLNDEEDGGVQGDNQMLSIMDGVYNNKYRKIFLLTTNSMRINDNLKDRPGRLRYIKGFGDLKLEYIEEIVDDKLLHKEWRSNIIKFIAKRALITVDIVKAIVEEINIHNEDPFNLEGIINIAKKSDAKFQVFEIDEKTKTETVFDHYAKVLYHESIMAENEEDRFYLKGGYNLNIDRRNVGVITDVPEIGVVLTDTWSTDEKTGKRKQIKRKFRLEPIESYHDSFNGYSF